MSYDPCEHNEDPNQCRRCIDAYDARAEKLAKQYHDEMNRAANASGPARGILNTNAPHTTKSAKRRRARAKGKKPHGNFNGGANG